MSPAPLSDLHFHWFWLLVASVVSRDRGIVWIIYVLFCEPITNGVLTAIGLPLSEKVIKACHI